MSVVEAFGALPPSAQALLLIGIVFVEAALLYAGYGLLEDVAAPTVFEQLRES